MSVAEGAVALSKACKSCVHYSPGSCFPTEYGNEYYPHECDAVPGMANLTSFPFKNTACKFWMSREQYNRPGPEGLSLRDIHEIQRRLGFRK